jgi:signal transduction histidine kinase
MFSLSPPTPDSDTPRPTGGPSRAPANVAAPSAASLTRSAVDARTVVLGLRPVLERLVGPSIDLAIAAGTEPAPVGLEPGRLEAILADLVANAREAMPAGGHLDIDVRRTTDYVGPRVPAGGQAWVEIIVSDSGVGIPADFQMAILRMSAPTGTATDRFDRGLVRVRSCVQAAGGWLELTSQVGLGTTVTLRLPLVAGR